MEVSQLLIVIDPKHASGTSMGREGVALHEFVDDQEHMNASAGRMSGQSLHLVHLGKDHVSWMMSAERCSLIA